MPTAVTEPVSNSTNEENKTTETRTDRMWVALKAHVLRERARKRQQREAEVNRVEEERLRRERERQDVMTLGETRVQISDLETRLAELKEEKHQLFRQLKKVLHEDDNRRRQLVKENDMLSVPQMITAPGMHPQLFLSSGPPGQPQAGIPPGTATAFKTSLQPGKRGRSPSPPPQQVPVTYTQQQNAAYAAYKAPQQPQYQPQKEDSRRPHEFVRAVLWNKPSQYTNQPQTSFYTVPPTERTPIVYYPTNAIPSRNSEPVPPRGPPGLYETYGLPPGARPPPQQSSTHVTVHGGAIPITPAQPVSKTGSITAGYPVRSQSVAQYQQQGGMYTTGQGPPPNRSLYTTPSGATLAGYPPPRD